VGDERELRHPRVIAYALNFIRDARQRVIALREVAARRDHEQGPIATWMPSSSPEDFARDAGELAARLERAAADVAQALPEEERDEHER
jgi:hypothetical protein